jgi:ABC-type Fe3+-siderophore transport system permease subunit
MWSRRFLWTGISSGTAVGALTLAGMFLVLFVWFGDKSPDYSKTVAFASPGVIVAPACWYVVIFRRRDYSLSQTMMLVGVAFGVVSMIVAMLILIVLLLILSPPMWKIVPFLVNDGEVAFRIAFAGALILVVPYVIVAPPMALLHRWLLLKIFASTGSVRELSRLRSTCVD